MVSHEKSSAETPIDTELVSEIQADVESLELYLSLSEALRNRVDRELKYAIEQKYGDTNFDIIKACLNIQSTHIIQSGL